MNDQDKHVLHWMESNNITLTDLLELFAVREPAKQNERKLGQIQAYVQMLQDGDPENENPKKILDTIEGIIGGKAN